MGESGGGGGGGGGGVGDGFGLGGTPMLAGMAGLTVLLVGLGLGFAATKRAREKRKRQAPLFGSTLKSPLPYHSVTVGVQPATPRQDKTNSASSPDSNTSVGQFHVFSETDLQSLGPQHERGLSSLHSRWSSQDADGAGSSGEPRIVEHSGGSDAGESAITVAPEPETLETDWKIWLKLHYEAEREMLAVTVFRAKASLSGSSYLSEGYETTVYVGLMLLPGSEWRQTGAYPNTGSPSFDETLLFRLNPAAVHSHQLRLSLYELNYHRTRICLGHALVRLDNLPGLPAGATHYVNSKLEPLSTAMEESPAPELHVSLSYNTAKEKLKVQIFAARNLPETKPNAETKFYLRTQVILGTRSVKTKMTQPSASLDGVFSAAYAFQVPAKHMDQCCIRLAVVKVTLDDDGRSLAEEVWAEAALGPCIYAHGTGLHHWKTMLSNTRKNVDMWHKLARR